MDWENISKQVGLTEDFIRDNQEHLHWKHISSVQQLSNDFAKEVMGYIDFEEFSYNPCVTEEHVHTFAHKLNCEELLMRFHPVSEELFTEMNHYIDWHDYWRRLRRISEKHQISFISCLIHYQKYIPWSHVLQAYSFSDEELHTLAKDVYWNKYLWKVVVLTQHLSPQFIETYQEELRPMGIHPNKPLPFVRVGKNEIRPLPKLEKKEEVVKKKETFLSSLWKKVNIF